MYIPIVQDGEIENEVFVPTMESWADHRFSESGWTKKQYEFVKSKLDASEAIEVPLEIDNAKKFIDHIKTMFVGE